MPNEIINYSYKSPTILWVQCTTCGNKVQYLVADEPRLQFLFCPIVRCNDTGCFNRKVCHDNHAQFPCDETCLIEVTPSGIRVIEPGIYWDYLQRSAERHRHVAGITYSSIEHVIDFIPEPEDFNMSTQSFAHMIGSIDTGGYVVEDNDDEC